MQGPPCWTLDDPVSGGWVWKCQMIAGGGGVLPAGLGTGAPPPLQPLVLGSGSPSAGVVAGGGEALPTWLRS